MEELLFRDTGSHVFGLNFLTFECPSLAQAEQIKYREPAKDLGISKQRPLRKLF